MKTCSLAVSVVFRGFCNSPNSMKTCVVRKPTNVVPNYTHAGLSGTTKRLYSLNHLTKNMDLISVDNIKVEKNYGFRVPFTDKSNKPLVIILPWMLAQRKHVMKYASFYMDQGFDVLTAALSPWQLLWPTKGSQLVAEDVLQFLHVNNSYSPLLLHGFSVGGYLWGEVLVRIKQDLDLYRPIVERIVGQVWDSAADITEIPVGFPRAVFPKNAVLQNALEKYIRYHMRTFHEAATIHYIRASQMFHTSLVRAPALFFFSKSDPIGCAESNLRAKSQWESLGVQTYVKCWDKSPHVGHFRQHPKEYLGELYAFLDKLNLVQYPEKIRAKL